MIVTEFYFTRSDGVNIYRSYSDKGLKVREIGSNEIYPAGLFEEGSIVLYEETDEKIE